MTEMRHIKATRRMKSCDPTTWTNQWKTYCVNMLEHLPWEESKYYEEEKNVIDLCGKAQAVFEELTERFVFVNGTTSNHAA